MSIEIFPEPPVRITREQDERFRRDYEKATRFMVDPPSYETYVRRRVHPKCLGDISDGEWLSWSGRVSLNLDR